MPAIPSSTGKETSIAQRSLEDESGLPSTDDLVLTPGLETRNNQQLRILWRRQGTKMIIRVVGLLTPHWAAAGGVVDSLHSVSDVSTALSSTIRSGLINGANGIHGVIAWVHGTFTPTYTSVGSDSSIGVDIATTSALGNIPDQQILNNVVQLLQSWGLNVPAPQQDNSLGLPQKRDLALNTRQLSNALQQWCLSPNTEILKVIGNGNPSTSLSYATACP
ncbi:hypothetical protein F4820DRAFT_463589 [Hypoxylon rubiginosum]|uniref:Uncharacterized protein n=1 Tax=Hypoxylon rubiginosum TaxID=110542 RepID=A0ACB9YU35_9PEZI|nr:hypothetical protein F4820DRAFT_463589 [Hypoxylon rubiginosum]